MRSIHRAAVIRAFLGILGGILGVNCNIPDARADDIGVRTIEAPPPPHRFGDRGDVAIPLITGTLSTTGYAGGAAWITFSHASSDDGVGGRSDVSRFGLRPELDVFVAKHLSLGGTAFASYATYGDTLPAGSQGASADSKDVTAGIQPRVGYAFALGDRVALWPRVGAGITAYDRSGNFTVPQTPFVVTATVDMPIVYAFDRHLYASIVPGVAIGGAPQNGRYQSMFAIAGGTSFTLGLLL